MQPRPETFRSQDAYLIKMNYDLMLEPGVPGPAWFEIGIELSAADDGRVAVVDAIPGYVLEPQEPAAYALDRFLTFVPGTDVRLPATRPTVDLFGVGGTEVRWRHMASTAAGVRAGSYTAWASLVVPTGCAELEVAIDARFDLVIGSSDARLHEPAAEPVKVVVKLADTVSSGQEPVQANGSGGSVPPRVRGVAGRPSRAPRVFVSYTHDDHDHTDAVLRFSEFLARQCGLDVHMDRWELDRRRNWFRWAIDQITAADFVLVIASPDCKRVGDGPVENLTNRGMQSEMSVLMDRLHTDRAAWERKLLPVVLPGRSVEEIPLFLLPGIADYYIVSELTVEGAEDLLRVITAQPPYERPEPNSSPPHLPTRPI
ncbi:SEFIR domain-containing protein [Nocardia sp. NPDC059240]|uniref:SEFIR domain-containing protein n=1 Tax=Nocardia sp. NPDC059240 TaxID=3346786 RepID=UPI003685A7EF